MKNIALALALTGAFVATSANAIVVIDSFDVNSVTVTEASGAVNVSGGTVIGGSRTLQTTGNSNTQIFTNGSLNIANPPSGGASVNTVLWDANGAGLGGLDLIEVDNDALQLTISFIDIGTVTATFAVTETAAAGGQTATLAIAGLVAGTQGFLFTDFLNYASVDFTEVESILMTINSPVNVDVVMDVVITRQGTGVPVPGTLALFGLGLTAVGLRRRKTA